LKLSKVAVTVLRVFVLLATPSTNKVTEVFQVYETALPAVVTDKLLKATGLPCVEVNLAAYTFCPFVQAAN
jgi:hypothetical protein